MFIKDSFKAHFYGKEKNRNLTICVSVLCFIDSREFPRDKDSLTRRRRPCSRPFGFAATEVADPFKDHRDCNLEEQPGGEENRQKERRVRRE